MVYTPRRKRYNEDSVAIGRFAGEDSTTEYTVSVGRNAGRQAQEKYAVAIGDTAGETTQGLNAIAVGASAGSKTQETKAIAIGSDAGKDSQKANAIAIGSDAGKESQKTNAIAIGTEAGKSSQGKYAIAIGAKAGVQNQPDYSIVISSSETPLVIEKKGFYVDPIRKFDERPTRTGVSDGNILSYTDNKEISLGFPKLPAYPRASEVEGLYLQGKRSLANQQRDSLTPEKKARLDVLLAAYAVAPLKAPSGATTVGDDADGPTLGYNNLGDLIVSPQIGTTLTEATTYEFKGVADLTPANTEDQEASELALPMTLSGAIDGKNYKVPNADLVTALNALVIPAGYTRVGVRATINGTTTLNLGLPNRYTPPGVDVGTCGPAAGMIWGRDFFITKLFSESHQDKKYIDLRYYDPVSIERDPLRLPTAADLSAGGAGTRYNWSIDGKTFTTSKSYDELLTSPAVAVWRTLGDSLKAALFLEYRTTNTLSAVIDDSKKYHADSGASYVQSSQFSSFLTSKSIGPSVGQIHTTAWGDKYTWNGTQWNLTQPYQRVKPEGDPPPMCYPDWEVPPPAITDAG